MKLKLVVASMSVLGLVSCPVFAATTVKHKHHHKVARHHVRVEHETVAMSPEAMEAAQAAPAAMNYKGEVPAVCQPSQTSMILDETTQNLGRALPNPCNPGWYNRIQVSGGATVDIGKWGNRNADYQGENYARFSLNDVYLNVSANVNDWTKAFVSVDYSNTTSTGGTDSDHYGYSSVYRNNDLSLEQAYATIGNFDVSPFYVQIGKQFQDFSRYEIHPITRTMTQVLSETLATSAKVGFIVPMGFNGSIFAFDDPIDKVGQTKTTTNYGAALGFEQPGEQLGWDVGAGWLYNMIGAQDVAHAVTNFTGGGYNRRADAVAVYGDVNSGPFTLGVRWTGAVSRFNPNDLPVDGFVDEVSDDVIASDARGAKPWAVGAQAGYTFDAFGCRTNNVYLGYQHSHEAVAIGLPKDRWLVGYDVEVWRNTNFGVEWDHDNAYSRSHGGTSDNTNLWTLRGGVKFG